MKRILISILLACAFTNVSHSTQPWDYIHEHERIGLHYDLKVFIRDSNTIKRRTSKPRLQRAITINDRDPQFEEFVNILLLNQTELTTKRSLKVLHLYVLEAYLKRNPAAPLFTIERMTTYLNFLVKLGIVTSRIENNQVGIHIPADSILEQALTSYLYEREAAENRKRPIQENTYDERFISQIIGEIEAIEQLIERQPSMSKEELDSHDWEALQARYDDLIDILKSEGLALEPAQDNASDTKRARNGADQDK